MFVPFRPKVVVPYEHVFCSARTSTLAQRARETLSLARAFLLLEDDDPVDWEVGQEELAPASHEPTWAPAHRAALHRRLTPRRGGQPAPPPQPCLCPMGRHAPLHTEAPQRGSRIIVGDSHVTMGQHRGAITAGQ
jgi:hypothetical protein